MAEDEQDGPDLETLQAQIDMSMAFTHSIVSGWMKSSRSRLPASSSRNEDKELKEYMRRPARLGVGASVPEATGVLSRETAKLRGKLTGKGRKRGREDEEDAAPPSAGAGAGVGAGTGSTGESEDEDDSRARAITKKARVDPFAPKTDKRKKKKKAKEGDAVAAPAGGKTTAAPSVPPAAGEVGVGVREEMSVARVTGETPPEKDAAQTSSPRKKKKKKKHKGGEDGSPHGTSITAPQDPTAGSPSIASKPAPTESHASHNPPETLAEGTKRVHGVSSSSSRPAQSSTTHASITSPAVVATASHNPLAVPLLNLSGPPPDTEQGHSESPKKKRKRRKKKKKTVTQHELGAAADGDDDESEDELSTCHLA
ncbi:hypothetical protein BD413DRAFT_547647 [Trametes elegans]|nr:hypothetical protein BD413DRAFT_547647 [Trametes elegans]